MSFKVTIIQRLANHMKSVAEFILTKSLDSLDWFSFWQILWETSRPSHSLLHSIFCTHSKKILLFTFLFLVDTNNWHIFWTYYFKRNEYFHFPIFFFFFVYFDNKVDIYSWNYNFVMIALCLCMEIRCVYSTKLCLYLNFCWKFIKVPLLLSKVNNEYYETFEKKSV